MGRIINLFNHKGVEDLEGTYTDNPPNNIRDALSPAFESKPKQIVGAECIPVPGNDNLLQNYVANATRVTADKIPSLWLRP